MSEARDERRGARRIEFTMPMRVELKGERRVAVSRNVSRSGVCIAVAELLEVGERATLQLTRPGSDMEEVRAVEGTIVRVAPNERDPQGLWPYLVGIAFDVEAAEWLEDIRAHQAQPSDSVGGGL